VSLDDQIPTDDWRDLLSALLDGELAPDEEARVRDLVAGSPDAQDELAALGRVRTLVRDLPAVDPPFGFYERMLRPPKAHRHLGAKVGGAMAAAAAAVVLIVGVTPATDSVVPPVAAYAERHLEMDAPEEVETVALATEPVASTDPAAADFEPMAAGDLDAMGAPEQLADGFERMSGYQNPTGALHLVYSDGTLMVSVYEQVGEVAWDRLPAGEVVQVGDDLRAWTMVGDLEEVMVFERGPTVFTVVATVDRGAHDEMVEMAEVLPPGSNPSMLDRFRSGCRSVAARFSMGTTEP
jgi:hypothetical protein